MKMSEFVRDYLKMDLLRYQEILLDSFDSYKKDYLKRNDILQKRFDIPMEKQNLKGNKGETIIDEFWLKDSDK